MQFVGWCDTIGATAGSDRKYRGVKIFLTVYIVKSFFTIGRRKHHAGLAIPFRMDKTVCLIILRLRFERLDPFFFPISLPRG